jgi:NTP pyrophosphatase (non-canonical NTP hydrolase)
MGRSQSHLLETIVSSREQVLATQAVLDERDRQDAKWGSQRRLSDQEWLTILVEEVGESAEAILDKKPNDLKTEVTQVAAVALAWLEALTERQGHVCSVPESGESHADHP